MAELHEDRPEVYLIPDNFIDEQRIINGMFRLRFFIEGVLLALLAAVPLYLFVHLGLYPKIILIISICGPLFLWGNTGLNGDPLSIAHRNWKSWQKNRRLMLYDGTPHALRKSLADATFEKAETRDKLLSAMENIKEARRERSNAIQYVEGETFEFAQDSELEKWAIELLEEEEEPATPAEDTQKEEPMPSGQGDVIVYEKVSFSFLNDETDEEPKESAEVEDENGPPKVITTGKRLIIGKGELY